MRRLIDRGFYISATFSENKMRGKICLHMYGNTIYLTKYTRGVQMQRGAKNIMIVVTIICM